MSAHEIPLTGTRETVGDTLVLLALLAVVLGLIGSDGAVLWSSGPMLISGLVLRRGRPGNDAQDRVELSELGDGGGHSQHSARIVDM